MRRSRLYRKMRGGRAGRLAAERDEWLTSFHKFLATASGSPSPVLRGVDDEVLASRAAAGLGGVARDPTDSDRMSENTSWSGSRTSSKRTISAQHGSMRTRAKDRPLIETAEQQACLRCRHDGDGGKGADRSLVLEPDMPTLLMLLDGVDAAAGVDANAFGRGRTIEDMPGVPTYHGIIWPAPASPPLEAREVQRAT